MEGVAHFHLVEHGAAVDGDHFARLPRPLPFQQLQFVEVAAASKVFDADKARGAVVRALRGDDVCRDDGRHPLHPGKGGDGVHVLLREAEGRLDVYVVGVVFDIIAAHRVLHVRRRLDDADEEADAESDDRHDGDEAPKTRLESLGDIFAEFFHAHALLPKKPLPLDLRNICGVLVDLFGKDLAVFDVDDAVCHLRDRLVVGDDDDRAVVGAADVVQQF